jgi:ribosome-binding factor A
MAKERAQKVAESLKREVSRIIQNELRDPGIGFITITKIDLTADLRLARVYYTLLEQGRDISRTAQALERAKGFIRKSIAGRIKLRFVPAIDFKFDESQQKAASVIKKLDELQIPRENELS